MKRTCIICEREFVLLASHRGYANRCHECNESVEEPERLGAEIYWEGKHTPVVDVTLLNKAIKFNRKNRRFGTSVLQTIAVGQETSEGREALGMNSGATPGSEYSSKLREKRHLKR